MLSEPKMQHNAQDNKRIVQMTDRRSPSTHCVAVEEGRMAVSPLARRGSLHMRLALQGKPDVAGSTCQQYSGDRGERNLSSRPA